MPSLEARPFKREDTMRWERFVDSSCASTFFHRIGWREVAERDGEIAGVLPLRSEEPLVRTRARLAAFLRRQRRGLSSRVANALGPHLVKNLG